MNHQESNKGRSLYPEHKGLRLNEDEIADTAKSFANSEEERASISRLQTARKLRGALGRLNQTDAELSGDSPEPVTEETV